MNKELILQIAEQIQHEPESWDQTTYHSPDYSVDPEDRTICGSSHCIAGWAVYFGDKEAYGYMVNPRDERLYRELAKKYSSVYWYNIGQELLGITDEQAEMLFDGASGPWGEFEPWEALEAWANGASLNDVWALA